MRERRRQFRIDVRVQRQVVEATQPVGQGHVGEVTAYVEFPAADAGDPFGLL